MTYTSHYGQKGIGGAILGEDLAAKYGLRDYEDKQPQCHWIVRKDKEGNQKLYVVFDD